MCYAIFSKLQKQLQVAFRYNRTSKNQRIQSQSLVGQAGVIKRLAQMVLDVDLETRTKASQAMLVLCADANGMQVT